MKMKRSKQILLVLACLLTMASGAFAQEPLQPGDVVRVWVKGEPELTGEWPIGRDGSIAYPLLGSVGVAGLKPTEAGRVIARQLDDGFLREPLVQVTVVKSAPRTPSRPRGLASSGASPSPAPASGLAGPSATAAPLVGGDASDPTPVSLTPLAQGPLPIEIVDRRTGKGVGDAVLFIGDRIYQGNAMGQIVLERSLGHMILLADGFEVLSGPVEQFIQVSGGKGRVELAAVKLPAVIAITVLDAATQRPVPAVEVKLDGASVTTNRQGVFRVTKILREFGEVELRKQGYRPLRKILDFNGPERQVLLMQRNE
jgi:hypothetical protein